MTWYYMMVTFVYIDVILYCTTNYFIHMWNLLLMVPTALGLAWNIEPWMDYSYQETVYHVKAALYGITALLFLPIQGFLIFTVVHIITLYLSNQRDQQTHLFNGFILICFLYGETAPIRR